MLDPPEPANPTPMPGLVGFLNEWGIQVGNDIVLDAAASVSCSAPTRRCRLPRRLIRHAITDRFNLMTAFPLARSVKPVEGGTGGHTAQAFVQTSGKSWAETDLKGISAGGQVEFNPEAGDQQAGHPRRRRRRSGHRRAAPLPTNASAGAPPEPPNPSRECSRSAIPTSPPTTGSASRATAICSSTRSTGSRRTKPDRDPAARSRGSADHFTQDQHQRIMLLSLLIVPGLVLAAGVYTWWRRR